MRVAFFPYSTNGVSYISSIQQMLQQKYEIVNFDHLRKGAWRLAEIDCIYLNWIEGYMEDGDTDILKGAKDYGTKIIWVFHNKLPHICRDDDEDLKRIKFLSEIADVIILHSHNSEAVLMGYFENAFEGIRRKLRYLPHPNYINDYRAYKYPLNNEIPQCEDDKLTFAFIGRIRPYKNVDILIKAFNSIGDNTDSRLLLAGGIHPNDYRKKIENLLNDRDDIVLFPYDIGSMEMARFLGMADVIVLPYSLRSSMNSGSMMMAFSYHKTVIIPDICMADDFPDEQIFMYHYDSAEEHVERLKDSMMTAYALGTVKLKEKGDRLYNLVEKDYSKEKVQETLYEIVDNLRG
ncbi:MAG: glycosyltransferase [Lachnospiraceae bacterium]|nr:glycosyltransferase [Lachnospiraceae bacterium]